MVIFCLFCTGLHNLLDPPHLPLALAVQELPQAPPHVQAADGLFRHGHPPRRVRLHPVRLHLTHVPLPSLLW